MARLYAENPKTGFLPSTDHFASATATGIRVAHRAWSKGARSVILRSDDREAISAITKPSLGCGQAGGKRCRLRRRFWR